MASLDSASGQRVAPVNQYGGDMSTYFVVNDTVTDPDTLAAYSRAAGPTLAAFGAKALVSTRSAETIEGTPAGARMVILEFADRAAFDGWYNSPAYQAILTDRLRATHGFGVVVEGR